MSRLFYAIPLIGWIARDLKEGGVSAFTYFLINCALLWIGAIALFGYPAIIIPALTVVPLMFVLLILLTRGRYEVG